MNLKEMEKKFEGMNSWCYGLVKEEEGLTLSEIYWKNKKPYMRTWVFRENSLTSSLRAFASFPTIIRDLYMQFKYYHIINYREFK